MVPDPDDVLAGHCWRARFSLEDALERKALLDSEPRAGYLLRACGEGEIEIMSNTYLPMAQHVFPKDVEAVYRDMQMQGATEGGAWAASATEASAGEEVINPPAKLYGVAKRQGDT